MLQWLVNDSKVTLTCKMTAMSFDRAKNNQAIALSIPALHSWKEKNKTKKHKEAQRKFVMVSDSDVEPDSHPCKLAIPQFKTSGNSPLMATAEVTEISSPLQLELLKN